MHVGGGGGRDRKGGHVQSDWLHYQKYYRIGTCMHISFYTWMDGQQSIVTLS